MNADDLQQLALRLSAFADTLGQHASRLVEETGQGTQALRQTAQSMGLQAQQLSRDVVQAVSTQSRDAVERGVADGMRKGGEQLNAAAKVAEHAADALRQELMHFRQAQRTLLWKAGLALLVGAALAAGGSSYLVWKNAKALDAAEFPTQILDAARSGGLNRCGQALCARIGKQPARHGEQGEYAEVR